ncbi:larval cuticle protein A2B-like [Anopheles aquasalis]|uniref:larval cuticle protein A2B-like n=1 Tax=Anopheles aquasalis TaxID=42839 RepID=UPI00215AF6EA|nr:larval cuticle protein A2B-like [Anopheles aquasalis]
MQFTVSFIAILGVAVVFATAGPVSSDGERHAAKYRFQYTVHDDHTGDIKSQHEERNGDHVVGQYTLIDSDGYRRIVDYSDKHTGFVANVHREPLKNHHVVPAVKAIPSIPVLKLAKTVSLAPAVHNLKPVHHVVLSLPQYTQSYHNVAQATIVKPAVYQKKGHNSHSHTSFKSGSVSYQY